MKFCPTHQVPLGMCSCKDLFNMRTFDTGATRSGDESRDDPEGYLSPLVIDRFCGYMTKHRKQADGSLRASDNWQKGMPLSCYAKGMFRHFLHFWGRHRGYQVRDEQAASDIQGDLCAIIFNAQGYLHEILKSKLFIKNETSEKVNK